MELFEKNSYGFQPLDVFAMSSVFDAWLRSEYTSDNRICLDYMITW